MFESCFAKLGTPLQEKQRQAFERAFFQAMKDPSLSAQEIAEQAIRTFSDEQRAALIKKEQQANKDIVALARNADRIQKQSANTKTKNEALARLLNTRQDGRSMYQSVESKGRAIYSISGAPTILKIKDFLLTKAGWVVNKENELELLEGLYSEKFNAEAKSFSDLAEQLRDRANKAGLDIGMLKKWGLPQAWDQYRVSDEWANHPAVKDLNAIKKKLLSSTDKAKYSREMFVDHFFAAADKQSYFDHVGKVMSDDELREYIGEAWRSIYYDGENKQAPRGAKSGLAKAMNAERQLFINKAADFQKLNDIYGAHNTLELMDGHLQKISKLIAMAEEFGPNADRVIKQLIDNNVEAATKPGAGDAAAERKIGNYIEADLDLFLGRRSVESMAIARGFAAIRNLQVLKLGGASISSIVDNANVLSETAFGSGSAMKFYANRIKQMKDPKAAKYAAAQAGIAADVIYHNAYSSWKDVAQRGWTGASASATNTLSLLNMLTRTRKEAYRAMRLNAITEIVNRENAIPNDINGKVMRGHGITDTDFAIYKEAAKGKSNITLDDVRNVSGYSEEVKNAAAERLVGMLQMDSSKAIIEQTGWVRMMTGRGKNVKGTWGGELLESFWMFKGYPWNAVVRMVDGYRLRGGYNAAAYTATTMALTTIFGGIAIELNDLVRGKNPRPILDPRFALASFLKGGALGPFGDYLFTQQRFGASLLETISGPVYADAARIAGITNKIFTGDIEDTGGDAVRLARTNTPFLGLWYLSAAVDHAFTYQVQEALSPGYSARMERRTQKEFGQSFWWSPNEVLPKEAPDLTEATR